MKAGCRNRNRCVHAGRVRAREPRTLIAKTFNKNCPKSTLVLLFRTFVLQYPTLIESDKGELDERAVQQAVSFRTVTGLEALESGDEMR